MNNQKIENQLITLAYSMAVEPQRWHVMTGLMDQWLLGFVDNAEDTNIPTVPEDTPLVEHLIHAMDLMERQGQKYNHGTSSPRFIDSELEPAALLTQKGNIQHCNISAVQKLGFSIGTNVPKDPFEHGEFDILLRTLRKIERLKVDSFVQAFNVRDVNGHNLTLALSVTRSVNNETIGRLTTISQSWHPSTAQQFKSSLNLTDTELAITKTIVSGQTLAQLAKQRGRSIGTVRNQLKALLTKLELNSKTELVCLYSGYARFNGLSAPQDPSIFIDPEPWRERRQLIRPDGTCLAYDLVGPEKGRPIIHFSDLVTAHGVTTKMRELLDVHNLRLVLPWRPAWGHSDPYATLETCAESFARDIEMLMDELSIQTCQTLGSNTGTPFQYAAGRRLPNRLLCHTSCSPTIPLHTSKQMKQMKPQQRVIFFLARTAPQLLFMYCRFAMAKVEAGYDEQHVASLFEDSPYDLATIKIPEIRNLTRNAFAMATMQGPQGIAWDLIHKAQLWDYLDPPYPTPILFLCAEHDPDISKELLADFIEDRNDIELRIIPKSGTMLHLQHPDILFKALDEQWAKVTKK
ncbi:MAG: hypothetical protein COA43_04650 [Robiginitomaculum sp.]|nr:MAG: hypothetical protein COA43_04650 [Robiginitomaculum sp.]